MSPQYVEWKIKLLDTLDVRQFREFLSETSVQPLPANDEVLLAMMHKARYDTLGCDRLRRIESAEWLRARGMTAYGGVPLLPYGQVPE